MLDQDAPRRLPNRRRFFGSAAAAALAGQAVPALALEQPKTFKLAHPDNKQHPAQRVAERFAAEVEQRSNGRLKIDVYPAGTLGSEINIVQGLQTGIVDFAMHTSGYLESFVPSIQVLDLPFIFKDAAGAEKALDHDVGREIADEMATKNIVQLAWGHYGWRQVETTDKEVTAPADLNGMKIRIQAGPVFAATFKAVGATPIVMDSGDVYVALQQKTITGVEVPFLAYVSNKYYEVAKFIGKTNHVYNAGVLMASKPRFDDLSKNDQKMIRTAGANQSAFWRATTGQAEVEYERQMTARGVKITNTDFKAFRAAMTPVYGQFKPNYPSLFNKVVAAGA